MSGYGGLSKLRKTFKRMEPEVRELVAREIKETARDVKKDAIGIAILKDIRDTDEMIRSIDYKMGRDGSTAVIGPGAAATAWQKKPWDNTSDRAIRMSANQKHMKMQFFKGYWQEFGTVNRPEKRSFMGDAWEANEPGARLRISRAVQRALEISARG